MIEIPDLKGKKLFDFLTLNKSSLVAQKKFEAKRGDPFYYSGNVETDKGKTVKANMPLDENRDSITVTSVINTTYWMDSHSDVHVDGLWKRSLFNTKEFYLLQEHSMTFKGIITDQVKAYTKKIAWRTLGVDFDGYTEALVFESVISKDRNTFMFDEYRRGHVKNHSVGMRYGKIELAINDEDYKEEFANWGKYIDYIANKEAAIEQGYYWPVTEAKVIEGSAVPIGSNTITPVTSVKNIDSSSDTHSRPAKSTRVLTELNHLSKTFLQ